MYRSKEKDSHSVNRRSTVFGWATSQSEERRTFNRSTTVNIVVFRWLRIVML